MTCLDMIVNCANANWEVSKRTERGILWCTQRLNNAPLQQNKHVKLSLTFQVNTVFVSERTGALSGSPYAAAGESKQTDTPFVQVIELR